MSRTCPPCTHDCNQGRNCPQDAASVTRVARRYLAAQPLTGQPWRRYLRHLARAMLIVWAVLTIGALALSFA